jgi:hypothetical protein
VTDGEGRYFLPSLRTGTYTLTADLTGFRRIIRSGLMLRLGQTLAIDFQLEPGGVSEEVVVTGDPPLLRTNAEISDVIENRQVVEIPLNGRNFLTLAQLSDGVVLPPGGTRGDALQQAGPLPNVGGQRSGHNIYLLDGFKVTDELFNNLVINPSVDSIQEFKIQKSQYPAEFGGKASALINVATRTGTNAFHANAFEFGRHDRFDAHNYFAPRDQPVPPLHQNQFGGTVGGPVSSQLHVLLRQLRRPAHPALADAHVLRPFRGRSRRRFFVARSALRPGGTRRLCGVSAEPNSREPDRSDRGGASSSGAAADLKCRLSESHRHRQADK